MTPLEPTANTAAPIDPELADRLSSQGYRSLCWKPGAGVCGVFRYLYTGGLVTGVAEGGHRGRYCYRTIGEALRALNDWCGEGDPPGAWVKYKSATEDRLGPGALE